MSLTPTPTVSFPLTTAATITTAITSTELDHDSKPDLRADSYFSSLLGGLSAVTRGDLRRYEPPCAHSQLLSHSISMPLP